MTRRFSTVTIAAASYDLTDLATARDELAFKAADTSSDTFLSRAISQVSQAIADYCNTVFPVERLQDTFYLLDDESNFNIDASASPLQLARIPAITILSITENGTALVEGTDFQVDYDAGQIFRMHSNAFLGPVRWHRPGPIIVTYDAGYGASLTEAFTIPGTPFQRTVSKGSAFAIDERVTKSDGTVFTKVASAPAAGQYTVTAAGVYTFAAADTGAAVSIEYSYLRLPANLAMAALQLVTMRYRSRGRDPKLVSHSEPGIGEDRWWVGTVPGGDSGFPPDVQGLIDQFRIPVV
jgi:hypothetical protein